VFTLILNGFADLYPTMALRYFRHRICRRHSLAFYAELLTAAQDHDPPAAEALARRVMAESQALWRRWAEAHGEPA